MRAPPQCHPKMTSPPRPHPNTWVLRPLPFETTFYGPAVPAFGRFVLRFVTVRSVTINVLSPRRVTSARACFFLHSPAPLGPWVCMHARAALYMQPLSKLSLFSLFKLLVSNFTLRMSKRSSLQACYYVTGPASRVSSVLFSWFTWRGASHPTRHGHTRSISFAKCRVYLYISDQLLLLFGL